MAKFILFLLKSGKKVRISTANRTYIHPTSGKRLNTASLVKQHNEFVQHKKIYC